MIINELDYAIAPLAHLTSSLSLQGIRCKNVVALLRETHTIPNIVRIGEAEDFVDGVEDWLSR